jgi:fatty-acyl-CoA synthase
VTSIATLSKIGGTSDPQSSYVQGACDAPLIGTTIGQLFDLIADAHADREALVIAHQNVRWTYAELKRRVDELAVALIRLGLEPGDRLGIWAPNCAEWVLTQFASAKMGAVLVNINPAYLRDELQYALNTVECRALIVAPGFRKIDYLAILRELSPEMTDAADHQWKSDSLP